MSDNNGWPGKPGVPLNPERDGWHWVKSLTTGGLMCAEWRADRIGWSLYRSTSEHHAPNTMFSWGYLGPCLTPAEVGARVEDEVMGLIHPEFGTIYGPNGEVTKAIAQARRDALEEAARRVEIKWLMFREKDNGASDWIFQKYDDIPTGDDFVAAIRALGEKE